MVSPPGGLATSVDAINDRSIGDRAAELYRVPGEPARHVGQLGGC